MQEEQFIRPRLTDFHGIDVQQDKIDFAIPFLNEDLPLYVDAFLLWKSPSMQDTSFHKTLIEAFVNIVLSEDETDAISKLILFSECDEVGLGGSATKRGLRIGEGLAKKIIDNCKKAKNGNKKALRHLEEVQLITDQISKDRICDFTCNLLKYFLIDFTVDQCKPIS